MDVLAVRVLGLVRISSRKIERFQWSNGGIEFDAKFSICLR